MGNNHFEMISFEDAEGILKDENSSIFDIRDEISYNDSHYSSAIHLTNENFRYFSESRFSKKANVKILDQWAVNETILANLINKFVVQIKTKDEKEIKSITDTEFKDVKNKFTKIEEVFKKCM